MNPDPLRPLTARDTRALLEKLELRPRKALGQNFLTDPNIVRKSLQLAGLEPGENVVEIGPGLGTLTRALLAAGAQVHAVEQDARLVGFLREDLGDHPRLHLLHGDACKLPIAGFAPPPGKVYKIVANLPYAISSPWLEAVLEQTVLPERMALLVQRETADRLTATPGSKHMSALAVFLEGAFQRLPGHPVAASCFHPRPRVESVLFLLHRRLRPHCFQAATRSVIRRLFSQRRKQIRPLARQFLPADTAELWLARLPSPHLRPEQLPFAHWKELDTLLGA